ncbi:hypothetical protein [Pseudorhodoferax soli]|nr:hypothetical protein [Pseudorhodoferax soli]
MKVHPSHAAAAAAFFCVPASAHFFVQSYTLPVPFATYAWSAVGALLATFLLSGLFLRARSAPRRLRRSEEHAVPNEVLRIGSLFGVGCLLICILCGLFGVQRAADNLNMTMFWVGFVLLLPYATAVFGDVFIILNPWSTIGRMVDRMCQSPVIQIPSWVGCWPAFLLFLSFIYIELFADLKPGGLSIALISYTSIIIAGSIAFGARAWIRRAEFFSIMFRQISLISPLAWKITKNPSGRPLVSVRFRAPVEGLLEHGSRLSSFTAVLVICFMLSSTSFDGIHNTLFWARIYWAEIYPHLKPLIATGGGRDLSHAISIFAIWQWLALLLSPFLYIGLFLVACKLCRKIGRTRLGTLELAKIFGISLVPIAFVYHFSHYYTLLVAYIGQLYRLASDPLGFGWDVFGTRGAGGGLVILDMGNVWNTQVASIIAGHVVSVFVAHVLALRMFRDARAAVFSQIPMLVLMMIFTWLGLWILSLPLTS